MVDSNIVPKDILHVAIGLVYVRVFFSAATIHKNCEYEKKKKQKEIRTINAIAATGCTEIKAKAATLSGINIHVQWNVLSVKYTTISVCWCVRHTEAERPTKLNEFNWQHPITSFIHLYYCILWNTCSFGIMFCTTKSNCWQRCKQRAKQQSI